MTMHRTKRINLVADTGERFSYYQNDEFRIGSGAMGEVYKGWYSNNPEYKVAIKKVYNRHAESPQIRERAKYEASLKINHPHIIKMLGFCQIDPNQGPIYIVSDLVKGTTIDKFVTNLDPSIRIDVISRMMCSILDALVCLHSQSPPVWHRDIKPSNIMVENGRNVRLMDLGIATSDGVSLGTLEGSGFGTYQYAPPEQVMGKRGEVNNKSDLYSLGVTYYELLTGINPFAGGADVDIMDKQIKMQLPYNESIPKPLFKILLKATAKKQVDRYQTAEEFKRAVIQVIEGDEEPKPWWENTTKIAIVIICILAVVLALILIIINS